MYYTVDLLHHAINHENTVEFQYIRYSAGKRKELKHDGAVYFLSPYDLVWNNDRYYVFGWSERHGKIVKFRVDRMIHIKEALVDYHKRPADYVLEHSVIRSSLCTMVRNALYSSCAIMT